ncbi:DUF3754 domain-containing protein [Acuticoccus sp. I52.16.1]|uniref:DUF3754 domain-containing protein n=1 Tax=Acuticoccus sp. I52.16.1 TaxID=2928472 RepID=UPI001FD26841|nr:DUF3754 domain-containing protein [Acuticoccus sp. I52.16.1]UOM33158.1 TMEM143 family protein [Acuticoccus sp. I52.16.1]
MDATPERAKTPAPTKAPARPKPFTVLLREIAGFPLPPEHEIAHKPIPASRFIPLTRQAVTADLCRDIPGEKDGQVFALAALRLERHRNHAYRALAREMRRIYLPFSPDADTLKVCTFADDERLDMERRLSDLTEHLLTRANYTSLETEEIDAILNEQSSYSLRIEVDLDEYDLLHVYARDVYLTHHEVRRPETAFLKTYRYDIRVYRRLFILLKLKSDAERAAEVAAKEGISEKAALKRVEKRRKNLPTGMSTDNIYIKVFKDMPEHDLQILFPLRRVQFRPFDKIKFYATAGGGTAFGVFSTTGKVVAATNPIAAVGALVAFGGLLARQVTGFFNQRNRYMMELSQKLFFHNLANNRAALTLLLDRAEEEDVKEDLITLYFLAGETVEEAELMARKRRIDEAIVERYGVSVDFEIEDALRRLLADGVVTKVGSALQFLTFAEAAAHYDRLLAAHDDEDARHIQEDPSPDDCDATGVLEA